MLPVAPDTPPEPAERPLWPFPARLLDYYKHHAPVQTEFHRETA